MDYTNTDQLSAAFLVLFVIIIMVVSSRRQTMDKRSAEEKQTEKESTMNNDHKQKNSNNTEQNFKNRNDFLIISQEHIEQWDSLLSNSPLIDNVQSKVEHYVQYIHEKLSRVEKGTDLGIAMFIAHSIQGSNCGVDVYHHVERISAEVNNRMVAHLLYNQLLMQCQYIDFDAVAENPAAVMIDMAQHVMSELEVTNETRFSELGIKGIEYIHKYILD